VPAFPGEFCRVVIGSTLHGLTMAETDDLDLMGVMVEPMHRAIPLADTPLEHYTWRTQEEGEPSGPGDVDLSVYTLRKFLRLASNGNPTVLNLLFVPPEQRRIDSPLADELRNLVSLIVSREAADRYIGYLVQQRERLVGERGQKRSGYARREKYLSGGGWDTKYAMHMCRLGVQGTELLRTGRITLPVPEPARSLLMAVRRGQCDLSDAVRWAEELEAELVRLRDKSRMPEHPDREQLERWMVSVYLREWAAGRVRFGREAVS
jgi:hypothetical protein